MERVLLAMRTVFFELKLGSLFFLLGGVIVYPAALVALKSYFHSHVMSSPRKILVVGGGFEPPKAFCQRIYSPPPLATRAPHHLTSGASGGTRTHNLLITNQPLCQLSYAGTVMSIIFTRARQGKSGNVGLIFMRVMLIFGGGDVVAFYEKRTQNIQWKCEPASR